MAVQAETGTHAEVAEVWPRDGVIRLVGEVTAPLPGPWTLEAVSREHRRPASLPGRLRKRLRSGLRSVPARLTFPVTADGDRFEVAVPVQDLAPRAPHAREHWDLLLVSGSGEDRRALKVGRWLDDMPGKKQIVRFPVQRVDDAVTVQPYFTAGEALAVRSRRKSADA